MGRNNKASNYDMNLYQTPIYRSWYNRAHSDRGFMPIKWPLEKCFEPLKRQRIG